MITKGQETKQTILDEAVDLASTVGLEQLTIGGLASAVGLSKSGLFAHFKSKEQLQIQVLETAAQRFIDFVIAPAIKAPRGEPRVRALMDTWLRWHDEQPGGCVIQSAAIEMDDRPGPVRDYVVENQQQWMGVISRAAQIAVEEGHFRGDLDLDQFAYEFLSVGLAYQHSSGLLNTPNSRERALRSFDGVVERARA